MYRFDKEKGILYSGQIDIMPEFDGYQHSDHYTAWRKYLYTDPGNDASIVCLINDLKMLSNVVVSNMNKAANGSLVNYFRLEVTGIRQHDRNSSLSGDEFCVVRGRAHFGGKQTSEFDILKLPQITKAGTFYDKGLEYAIICSAEPSKFITYNGRNTLSIVTKAKKIDVKIPLTKKATINLNSKDISLYDAIAYLNKKLTEAYDEHARTNDLRLRCLPGDGITYNSSIYTIPPKDVWSLIEQVETPDNVKYCYDSLKIGNYGVPKKISFSRYGDDAKILNTLDQHPKVFCETFGMVQGYSRNGIEPSVLEDVRRQLNELMSINRGEGRILSRDVYDGANNLLAREGEIVSKGVLAKFNSKRVNCYYVKSKPAFQQGSELATMIPIASIPEGVYIPATVREQVPARYLSETGITTAKVEFPLGQLLLIRAGSIVTRDLLRFISSCEIFDTYQIMLGHDNYGTTQLADYTKVKGQGWDLGVTKYRIPIVKNKYSAAVNTVTDQEDSKYYLLFEEEILGNRHFMGSDGWVFAAEDGQEAPASPYLTIFDLVSLLSITYRLKNNQYINLVADKDLGVRKKFCLIDDHIHEGLLKNSAAYGSKVYRNVVKRGTDSINDNFALSTYYDIIKFLGGRGKKVLMLADVTNPAAYVSSASRVSSIVADSNAATNTMRLLAMGYYSRICPYETPQSQKLGLTNSKAHRAKIVNNEILTPYYQVLHIGGRHKVDVSKKIWLTIQEEEKFRIADLLSLELDEHYNIKTNGLVLARVPAANALEKMEVQNIHIGLVEYVNCYPDQTLSATATTIPYIGSNDAVRVSYGLSMARQSRSLMHREVPTIMTYGNFDMPRLNDKFMVVAEGDGIVTDVMVKNLPYGRFLQRLVITVAYYDTIEAKIGLESALSQDAYNHLEVRYEYPLIEYNHQSVIVRKAEVVADQMVKKGDVLVSSNFTKDGFMTTTVNAFVGICPAGYNYEDGVYMSGGLRKKLTSFGHTEDVIKVSGDAVVAQKNSLGYHYSNISRLVEWSAKLPNGDKFSTSNHLKGYLVEFRKEMKKQNQRRTKAKVFKAHGISFNPLSGGDKIANRHGNKGVVPKVVKDEDMFYLANGQVLDILYNPAGIGSRMNLGQLKEAHIGLALYVLGMKLCLQSFNEVSWDESTLLLEYAWDCANLGVDTANQNPRYAIYPEAMRSYVKDNEHLVGMWKGVFEKDGTAYLFDPRTGKRKHGRVVIGINSVYKLIQESEDKLNARGGMVAGSSYVKGSARPVKGAKVNGGQTIGHMELQGLVSHGAKAFLKEMFQWRGDNIYERQIEIAKALGTYENLSPANTEAMERNKPRRATEEFFATMKALGLDIIINEPEPYLPPNTREAGDERVIYPTRVIRGESRIPVNRETIEKVEEFTNAMEAFIDEY